MRCASPVERDAVRLPMLWAFLVLGSTLAGCGGDPIASGGSSEPNKPGHVLQAFEVVDVYPAYGPGSPVAVVGARLQPTGELQVLLDGFPCGVPTQVNVDESPEAVEVGASAARYEDGDCPANTIPWFVTLELGEPLGVRPLRSAQDGTRIAVLDCAANPDHPWCKGQN